mgnify:CR=1 FL=1
MKNILTWVKSNILIVIFIALIVISLPAAFIGSSMWRDRIVTLRKAEAEKRYKEVDSLNVNYTLPTYDPGQKPIQIKSPPNTKLTEWFKAERDRLDKASVSVVKRAEDFNQGIGPDAAMVGRKEFKPFVDGLFPEPKTKDELVAKLNEMEEVLLAKRNRPNPYQMLLDGVRAGSPADPIKLGDSLNDFSLREVEKITAGKRALTNEEAAALGKQLEERRLGEYQAAAKDISVYASIASLPTSGPSQIPWGKIDPENIEINHFFKYQWDYWTLSDIFAAVRLANSDGPGKPTDVEHSVVKRIESIVLLPVKGLGGRSEQDPMGMMNASGMPAPAAALAVPGLAPLDLSVSITGRESGPSNTAYDVRRIELTVVASSSRINEFLDAVTRTNFMSITDLDLTAVDEWADIKQGFYYGGEHVVRAEIGIESVWLRSWMVTSYMPKDVQAALGVPGAVGSGAAMTDGTAGGAAPGVPPTAPRGQPPAPGGGKSSRGSRGGG